MRSVANAKITEGIVVEEVYYKSVTRVLQECYKILTRVSQERSAVLQQIYNSVPTNLQEC
jgi:hypothetical protein